MISYKTAYEATVSLVFPRRCPVCDRPVKPYGGLICDECRDRVGYVHGATCYKCGKPLDDETLEYCEDCARSSHIYKRGMSLFEYRSVSDSIYRFKYKGRREYADWYGAEMARHLGRYITDLHPDMLIPVPIHESKKRIRGYNQASLIAHSLSEHLGIPVGDDLVRRVKRTTPLKDLAPSERNIILRGAFKLTADDVKLKTIMVIDDIYTTGATIDAVAEVFAQHGVTRIYFTTLAIGKGL